MQPHVFSITKLTEHAGRPFDRLKIHFSLHQYKHKLTV
jgi:hypothetical protein